MFTIVYLKDEVRFNDDQNDYTKYLNNLVLNRNYDTIVMDKTNIIKILIYLQRFR